MVRSYLNKINKQLADSGCTGGYDWPMYAAAFKELLADLKKVYRGTPECKIEKWSREGIYWFLNQSEQTTLMHHYKQLVAKLYFDANELSLVKTSLGPIVYHCNYCSSTASLRQFKAPDTRVGRQAYICDGGCDAHVGFHKGDRMPLGMLADASLRRYRQSNLQLLRSYEETNKISRKAAYELVAAEMKMTLHQVKIARLDFQQNVELEKVLLKLNR